MRIDKSEKALLGTGVLTAFAASLCCITPVLAIVAGGTGIASSLSWLEPFRPYLFGFSILVIGFAWYQKLTPLKKEELSCSCETDEKPSFWQSKRFLAIITVFAILMLVFPYYSTLIFPNNNPSLVENVNTVKIQLNVKGMTCPACNFEVNHAAKDVDGVISASTDYKQGKAEVLYDKRVTTREEVVRSINEKTPYKVVE